MHRPMLTLVMGPPAPLERYTVSPHTKINARFLGLFSIFLFCRFRLTRNVKGFLLGGRELSPNRPEKCQISSEMSANSQQMVPCRPDRRGGISGIPHKSLARHSKDDAQENLIIERPTAVGRFLPSAEGADWEIAKYDPV